MNKSIAKILLILTIIVLVSSTATANTIYSTFGTGDSYNTILAWAVNDSHITAAPFTPLINSSLNSVEVAVSSDIGSSEANFTIYLTEDSTLDTPDWYPGSGFIESFSFTAPSSNLPSILYIESILNPILYTNEQYWLVAVADINDDIGWYLNSLGIAGISTSTDGGYTWSVDNTSISPAFRLNGTVIPEPSTFLLLGAGLVGLGFVARRRRKG